MSRWIDVNDRLPEDDHQVYCVCELKDKNTGESRYVYGVGNYLSNLHCWVGSVSCQYTIFWRDPDPLPDIDEIQRHYELN